MSLFALILRGIDGGILQRNNRAGKFYVCFVTIGKPDGDTVYVIDGLEGLLFSCMHVQLYVRVRACLRSAIVRSHLCPFVHACIRACLICVSIGDCDRLARWRLFSAKMPGSVEV